LRKGFLVLPRRWIVERTLAWLGRSRGLAKDWECLNRKALALSASFCISIQAWRATGSGAIAAEAAARYSQT
jgi:transposase